MDVNNTTKRKNSTNAEISPKRNISNMGPTNVPQGPGPQQAARLPPFFGSMPGYSMQQSGMQFSPGFMPPQCPPIRGGSQLNRDIPNFGPGFTQFPQRMWGPYDSSFGNCVPMHTPDAQMGLFGAPPAAYLPPRVFGFPSQQQYGPNMPLGPLTNPRVPFGPPPPLMGPYSNVGAPPTLFNFGSEDRSGLEAASRDRSADGRPFNARNYNDTRREDADFLLPKDLQRRRMDSSQKRDEEPKTADRSSANVSPSSSNQENEPKTCEAIIGLTLHKFFNDQLNMNITHRADGTRLNSTELMNRMVHIGLRGARMAEKISFLYRSRPCFKRIDTLCARMQQDVTRQDNVLPNINSQGISWAVKDFIFVFTRIMSAWLIMRGYVYSTPDGLDPVRQRLCPDFFELFDGWQQITARLLVAVVFGFLNLHDECQEQKTCKSQGKSSSPPTGGNTREPNAFDKEFYDDLSFLVNLDANLETPPPTVSTEMIDESEETQLNAMANGTYFKTGCYKPLPKKTETGGSPNVSFSSEPATADGDSMDDSDSESLGRSYGSMRYTSPSNESDDSCVSIIANPSSTQHSSNENVESIDGLEASVAYEVAHQVLGGLIDECSLIAEGIQSPTDTVAHSGRRYLIKRDTGNTPRQMSDSSFDRTDTTDSADTASTPVPPEISPGIDTPPTATSSPTALLTMPGLSRVTSPKPLQHSASDGLLYPNMRTLANSIGGPPESMPSPDYLAAISRHGLVHDSHGNNRSFLQQPNSSPTEEEVVSAAQVIVAHANARQMATTLTLEASLSNNPEAIYRAAFCTAAASSISKEEVEHARRVLSRNILSASTTLHPIQGILNEAAAASNQQKMLISQQKSLNAANSAPNFRNVAMSTSAFNENFTSNSTSSYGSNSASPNPYTLQSSPLGTYQAPMPTPPPGFCYKSVNSKPYTQFQTKRTFNTPPPAVSPSFKFNPPTASPVLSNSSASQANYTTTGPPTTPPVARCGMDDDLMNAASPPPAMNSFSGSSSSTTSNALPSFETSFSRTTNSGLSNSTSDSFNVSGLFEGNEGNDNYLNGAAGHTSGAPQFNAQALLADVPSWGRPFDAMAIIRQVHEPSAEMAIKINTLRQRMLDMKHMQYFFKFQFTRFYFPDLMPHLNGLLDLQSIIKKSERQGYTHIFEMLHDIRLIIYTVKTYLQEAPSEVLRQILLRFEAEFDAIIDKYPFSKLDYNHIQGQPGEKIYHWNIL